MHAAVSYYLQKCCSFSSIRQPSVPNIANLAAEQPQQPFRLQASDIEIHRHPRHPSFGQDIYDTIFKGSIPHSVEQKLDQMSNMFVDKVVDFIPQSHGFFQLHARRNVPPSAVFIQSLFSLCILGYSAYVAKANTSSAWGHLIKGNLLETSKHTFFTLLATSIAARELWAAFISPRVFHTHPQRREA